MGQRIIDYILGMIHINVRILEILKIGFFINCTKGNCNELKFKNRTCIMFCIQRHLAVISCGDLTHHACYIRSGLANMFRVKNY